MERNPRYSNVRFTSWPISSWLLDSSERLFAEENVGESPESSNFTSTLPYRVFAKRFGFSDSFCQLGQNIDKKIFKV